MPAVTRRLARVLARQAEPVTRPAPPAVTRCVTALRAPDLACSIDGSMPSTEGVASSVVPMLPRFLPRLRVTTHAKRFGITEVRFIHERARGDAMRVGKLSIPRALWLTLYRRMLLWAHGEALLDLTLDEHASPAPGLLTSDPSPR